MADDIVARLRVIHCAADDLTPCGTCLPCQAAAEIERLRALADQLANALKAVQHDRPSAHTDDVWAAINQALITYKEVRRG